MYRHEEKDEGDAAEGIDDVVFEGADLLIESFEDAVHNALHVHKWDQRGQDENVESHFVALVEKLPQLSGEDGKHAADKDSDGKADVQGSVDHAFQPIVLF